MTQRLAGLAGVLAGRARRLLGVVEGGVTGRRRRSTDAVVGDDQRRRIAVRRWPALGTLRRRRLVTLTIQLTAWFAVTHTNH